LIGEETGRPPDQHAVSIVLIKKFLMGLAFYLHKFFDRSTIRVIVFVVYKRVK
jgi:hypothetical protein